MTTTFYISGAVAVIATLMVITRLNAVHALLYLVVSLLAVAVTFYTLGAPFVAALEVIIYAGAIMVLLLFVIMLLNLGPAAVKQEKEWLSADMWTGPLLLTLVLVAEFVYLAFSSTETSPAMHMAGGTAVNPQQVGLSLFSTYLLGTQLAGMLLLAGLIGAWHIGRRFQSDQVNDDLNEDDRKG